MEKRRELSLYCQEEEQIRESERNLVRVVSRKPRENSPERRQRWVVSDEE